MNKQIILSPEKKKALTVTFKVSRQTVWAALQYRTYSKRSDMLRAAALQRGGVIVEEGKVIQTH